MTINRWIVTEPPCRPRLGCVIGLTGRNNTAEGMEAVLEHMLLRQSLCVVLEPHDLAWYPAPNGAHDQEDALEGMQASLVAVEKRLALIQRAWRLKRENIALVGFSAGAVMALQLVARSEQPLAACVCLAGAILDPDALPEAKQKTPILLKHNEDDLCFSWEERYLPMRSALTSKGYNVYTKEGYTGGHSLSGRDVLAAGNFLANYLGYKNT